MKILRRASPIWRRFLARLWRAALVYWLLLLSLVLWTAPPAREYVAWCLRRDAYTSARENSVQVGPGPARVRFVASPPYPTPPHEVRQIQWFPHRLGLRVPCAPGREVWAEATVPFGLYQVWGVPGSMLRFTCAFLMLVGGVSWLVLSTSREIASALRPLADQARSIGESGTRWIGPETRANTNEIDQVARALGQMADQIQQRRVQLEQAEADLRQAADARNHLLALVSHELRTPMTAVLGYSQLILDGLESTPLTAGDRAVLVQLEARGQEMLEKVERLLLACRLESGTFPVGADEVFLSECLESAWSDCPSAILEEPPPPTLVVRGDFCVLRTIFVSVLCSGFVRVRFAEDTLVFQRESAIPTEPELLSPEACQRLLRQMGCQGTWQAHEAVLRFRPC